MKLLYLIITLFAVLYSVHCAVVAPKDDDVTNGYLCGSYCGYMVPDTSSHFHDSKKGMCDCKDEYGSVIDSRSISQIRNMREFSGI